MKLESILNEIESLKAQATMDPAIGPVETSVGRQGLKRSAVERTNQLKREYAQALKVSSLFIVVTGASRQSFCELVSNPEYGCFSLDSDKFYMDLISKVNPTLFGKERTNYLFNGVADALWDRAMDLGINSYNQLQYSDRYSAYVKTPEELLPIIRTAINEQVGAEIVGLDAYHSIVDSAIERKHVALITPIVLSVSDESVALVLKRDLARLTSKVYLVAAGKASRETILNGAAISVKNVNKETVESALGLIRSKL